MTARYAACGCEQLQLTAEGDPVRISVCHCLACQRRTGSAFGVQAGAFADPGFPAPRVSVREERRHSWLDLPGVPGESRHQRDD
jgi:hypothetical protein